MNKGRYDSKPEIIKVRLSTSFMVRARCKHCKGAPEIYYFLRNPTMWFNPRKALDQANYIKQLLEILQKHGFKDDPKHYTSASYLSHDVIYAKYRPRMHRTRGSNPVFDIVEFLTCDCMKTTWAYSDKAISNRPEITCRKARARYPLKFEF